MSSGLRSAALGALLLALGCASAPSGALRKDGADLDAPPPTDQQVMVTYRPAPLALWNEHTAEIAQQYRLNFIAAWTMESLGEQCVVFEVPRGRSAREVVRRLSSDPRVSLAQPVETFHTQGQVGDPYARLQHGSATLRLEQAHRFATGKGVKVAVVDTGADFDHPDLRDRMKFAHSFVDRGEKTFSNDIHGTAVIGLIAATADNGIGIAGAAPQAEIYALKACWEQPPGARQAVCNSYTLALAVDYVLSPKFPEPPPNVINFSLAGPTDPLLGKLIDRALAKGIVVVAADGGTPNQDFPANHKGVIGVMGSDDLNGPPTVPAGHSRATLAAPGVDIMTTMPHGAYDLFSGSSAAAAEVSGIAALLLEKNPKLTPAQVAEILQKSGRAIDADPVSEVDACAALASVGGGCR
ncbi:MAG TPA: S8 family serine peptidase [Thermoanaerobaculia bacterium]